jgi:hypothetical protein
LAVNHGIKKALYTSEEKELPSNECLLPLNEMARCGLLR